MNTPQGEQRLLGERYRLLDRIGQGGMAVVYRALDEHLGREVAVKLFRATSAGKSDVLRQETELKMLGRLIHHSLVTLLDAGTVVGEFGRPQFFLVMELVDGEDLLTRLQREPLTPRQIAQLGYDIAEGLEYIHHHGIVHRDIKPANILLSRYSDDDTRLRAKLTDFGIAKLAGTTDLTDEGTTMGTAAYLSPEQARGLEIRGASDVYSLGLVLLECFTGRLEFPGAALPAATARLSRDPVIPQDLPKAWRELLTAMTERNPEYRPTVPELILALREIIVTDLSGRIAIIGPADETVQSGAEELQQFGVLETPPEEAFDRIIALAARLFKAPIAMVNLVDHDGVWSRSHIPDLDEAHLRQGNGSHGGQELRLCASTIAPDPRIPENIRLDPSPLANRAAARELGFLFYGGVPLRTSDGHDLGTLCVLDFRPRTLTREQVQTLKDLGAMVTTELELRLQSRMAVQALTE